MERKRISEANPAFQIGLLIRWNVKVSTNVVSYFFFYPKVFSTIRKYIGIPIVIFMGKVTAKAMGK